MSMKCTKCGYTGPNLIVEISGNKTYITCRNCNRTTTFDSFKKESDVKELPPMHLVQPSDGSAANAEIVLTEAPKEIPETINEEPTPTIETEDESPSQDTVEAPLLHTPEEVCPKCGSASIEIEMSTAKLGFITCRDCGYDSKSEGKRHKIGN